MTFPLSTSHYMQLYVFLWLTTERDPDLERADSEKVFVDPGTMEKHSFPSITSEPSIGITLVVPAYNEQKRCKCTFSLVFRGSLTSQTHFRKKREGSGELCIQKPCPTVLYSVVQSCSSICHVTHYITI